MFQEFPYTDMHQLNLDWIIKIAKDFLDQYTHIQQLITDGEQSLQDLTSEGLQQLQDKADNLETLLQAWYDSHSQDIADQLEDALADLNEWYTTHQNYLDETLAQNITAFNNAADEKTRECIESIPSDYTDLFNEVVLTKEELFANDLTDSMYNDTFMTKNIFNKKTSLQGYTLSLNYGIPTVNASTNFSDFICVANHVGETLYFSLNGNAIKENSYRIPYIGRYDKKRNYLGYVTKGTSVDTDVIYTIQSDDAYIRVVYLPGIENLFQIEYDGVTSYRDYSVIGTRLLYSNAIGRISQMAKTMEYIEYGTGYTSKQILLRTGAPRYDANYPQALYTTDLLILDELLNKTIENAESWQQAGAYPLAFYDANGNVIGEAYAPDATVTQHPVTIEITHELVAQYPDAVFIRVGGNTDYKTKITDSNIQNPYPTYKITAYPKIFFGGDSVTAGFVIEGTPENPSQIYEVMPEQSYPKCFGRIYGNDITIVAQSGISPYQYYYNKYPSIDFSQYDMIIIELGLNHADHGYINIADINTVDSSTWCLKKIIEGARAQNPDAPICLVRSQYHMYATETLEAFIAIANQYNAIFIDLHNTKYLNLADDKFHGYFDNAGTPTLDHAHFTRAGYAAKAYVMIRLLGDYLPD